MSTEELWTPTDASYTPKTLKKGPGSKQMENSEHDIKVLVLFTGGTIGMIRGPSGAYEPFSNMLEAKLRTMPNLHDPSYSFSSSLVLPNSLPDEHRRVFYTVYEYDPLLDSSNMTIDDWIRIALDIKRLYNNFDGFVILHGTDTMAYTASALSFMIQDLKKPIVITGSQIPIFESRTDGQDNFQGALIMAGHYLIPEVTIYFNHRLYRGNRTTKVSTDQLNAFDSPNMGPLVDVGVNIKIDWKNVLPMSLGPQLRVHTNMCRLVSVLTIFPSIPIQIVKAHLEPPLKGLILMSFGAGNIPTVRKDLMEELKSASERGVLIINITQCLRGCIAAIYETGRPLVEAGVIPGADLTLEAALAKLSYVLGRDDWDSKTKRKMLQTNLRGEMWSESINKIEKIKLNKEVLNPIDVCDAIDEDREQLINIITQQKSSLSCVDSEKRTPLHVAAAQGNYKIFNSAAAYADVKILGIYKNLGFDFNLRDAHGRTSLHQAVLNNRLECVNFLLSVGVNPLLLDHQGFSSYDLAKRLGLTNIENSLQNFACN
ncbi:hypothetical protein CHUAL_011173 [Chamberlinius hualienensis]